jgi:hypothetical protein
MAKFNQRTVVNRRPEGFMKSTSIQIPTFEGGTGYKQDAESELFRLAALNMGNDSFYETASTRDNRLLTLINEVSPSNPGWMAGFVPFLRGYLKDNEIVGMNMRRSSLMMGVEYGRALNGTDRSSIPDFAYPRSVLSSAMQRADEPGEALAYYLSRYGRKLPMWFKRGVADGAQRLYTQYSALKYGNGGVSMGDVIELTHPVPRDVEQEALFRYLAYKHEDVPLDGLTTIQRRRELDRLPSDQRRALLGTEALEEAGATWEWVSGWVPKMDAKVWESVIPTMGYMALLRNLRNFEEKGVSEEMLDAVAEKLMNPEAVAMSRQFPYRFLSAYRELSGTRFIHPLEKAVELSVRNIPRLKGRTLILQDISQSMTSGLFDQKSKMTPQDAGALFGAALSLRAEHVDWVFFATTNGVFKPKKKAILPIMDEVRRLNGIYGGGTNTFQALAAHYKNHDRIIVISDSQAFPFSQLNQRRSGYSWDFTTNTPADLLNGITAPIYSFDLGGYAATHIEDGPNRYTLGGLTDSTFKQIELLESGKDGVWPWMI